MTINADNHEPMEVDLVTSQGHKAKKDNSGLACHPAMMARNKIVLPKLSHKHKDLRGKKSKFIKGQVTILRYLNRDGSGSSSTTIENSFFNPQEKITMANARPN